MKSNKKYNKNRINLGIIGIFIIAFIIYSYVNIFIIKAIASWIIIIIGLYLFFLFVVWFLKVTKTEKCEHEWEPIHDISRRGNFGDHITFTCKKCTATKTRRI